MPIKYNNRTNNGSNTPNGIVTWTSRASVNSNLSHYCVGYGNGRYVAGGDGFLYSSTDGISWTYNQAASLGVRNVTYGNGKWVAVTPSDSNTGVVFTSTNGTTWTDNYVSANIYRWAAAYGNGVWVICSEGGNYKIARSTDDAVSWTNSNPASLTAFEAYRFIAFGGGTFLILSYSGPSSATRVCCTSTDGINWTARLLPTGTNWNSAAYGNGIWVAVGRNAAARSTDGGATWSNISGKYGNSVTYGDGYFVIVGDSGEVSSSPDGITWTTHTSPLANIPWSGVTYGNGLFVAVSTIKSGASQTPNFIMTAPMTYALSVSSTLKFRNRNNNTSVGKIGFRMPS